MNRMSLEAASLHDRREDEEGAGINGDAYQNEGRKNACGDHQNAAQRLDVLVHSIGLPGSEWSLTNALVNARSAHG